MEECFIDDYVEKIKLFKRDERERGEYEGEYTFIVKVGLIDNVVEIKETTTYCQLSHFVNESNKSDEEYKPESVQSH